MNRTTPQDKKEIRHLDKKGWSNEQIGKKFGVSKQTIMYHLGKVRKKTYDGIGKDPSEIPAFIRKNLEKPKKSKVKKGYCQVCKGRIKDKKFIKTNYCSLKCFKTKI